jgi:LacI family transcriptional regulator
VKPTLSQLAAELGVSKMTVSRALRDLGKVSPGLAQRIRDRAAELGYRPDPRATAVMQAFRGQAPLAYRETLGFIWTSADRSSRLEFEGARAEAEALGYTLDEFEPRRERLSGRRMAAILKTRGVRGLILSPHSQSRNPHYWLPWEQFSCVLLGASLRNHGLPRIHHDHFHAAMTCMRQFRQRGYTRVALLIDESMHERSWRKHAAAFALYAHPMPDLRESLFIQRPANAPGALRDFLTAYRPDAVLADTTTRAREARELLGPAPGIAVLALGGPPPEPGHPAEWAGIHQASHQLGRESTRLLIAQLQNAHPGLHENPPTIQVPGHWVDGASLPHRRRPPERTGDL